MIAPPAIYSSGHGVADQAFFECLSLHTGRETHRRIERLLSVPVRDQLDAAEEAAAADVADIRVLPESFGKPVLQHSTHECGPFDQTAIKQLRQDCVRGRRGNRMTHIRVAVLKKPGA